MWFSQSGNLAGGLTLAGAFVAGYMFTRLNYVWRLVARRDAKRAGGVFAEISRIGDALERCEKSLTHSQAQLFEEAVFLPHYAGPYATLGELQTASEQREEVLSDVEEFACMENFSYIVSLPFFEAKKIVEEKGYFLKVLYVNDSTLKMPAPQYSQTTIGVKVKDSAFDYHAQKPSPTSTISAIVDIGGQDRSDRGQNE